MHTETVIEPSPWTVAPFGLLLVAIALAPLLAPDWWHKHYPKVAIGLGAITVGYYLISLEAAGRALQVGREYVSFIALIGSLFVVAGGIHVNVKGEATPRANVVFLFIGSIVANLLGTTGASMLLIRPWLRMNKYRLTAHHVVFFIFLVSNVGGCLTPVGDPPLFLGYLKGVPFWWVTSRCWPMWALAVGFLLIVFYVLDRRNYMRAPASVRERLAEPPDQWRFDGLRNIFLLAVVLGAVFIKNPPFLREAIMVSAAFVSWFVTPRSVHDANHFNFNPLREVAILFVGIFATMMPALDWLHLNAARFGDPSPARVFWLAGILSSMLDNAPTYLTFLSAVAGTYVTPEMVGQVRELLQTGAGVALAGSGQGEVAQAAAGLLQQSFSAGAASHIPADMIRVACLVSHPHWSESVVAVSVGSVFFGAATYIGNGPNFMVKAMAEEARAHVPTFMGYVFGYALPFMGPMLLLVWWVFFRH